MSRTLAGNLTGRAAQTERRELAERIEDSRASFAKEWNASREKLEALLGFEFDAWWDSYPEQMTKRDFLPIMKEQIATLEAYEKNAGAANELSAIIDACNAGYRHNLTTDPRTTAERLHDEAGEDLQATQRDAIM